MNDYLTAKEVIELLKIDRTTLYRMLKEGRINGIKIGSHWRFSQKELNAIGKPATGTVDEPSENSRDILPLHCIEPVQEVFSDMAQVAAVTTDKEGIPLSKFSNSCKFCNLILSTEEGKKGCYDSWRRVTAKEHKTNHFSLCHAGLNYAKADISLDNKRVAMLVAGQFYSTAPDPEEEKTRIKKLAEKFNIDYTELLQASKELHVIDDRIKMFMGKWMNKVAKSFETIAHERKELMGRLKNIAEISGF